MRSESQSPAHSTKVQNRSPEENGEHFSCQLPTLIKLSKVVQSFEEGGWAEAGGICSEKPTAAAGLFCVTKVGLASEQRTHQPTRPDAV